MIYEKDEPMFDHIRDSHPHVTLQEEGHRYHPKRISDTIAKSLVHLSALGSILLFRGRYGHRAIVLESIAAIPGMVGATLQHLKALRLIRSDNNWIRILLDEAENERIHLLVYSEVAKPTWFERFLITCIQVIFFIIYFLLYSLSPRIGHRVVGYFEEEAIHSYKRYAALVTEGLYENIDAPVIAKEYWNLGEDAKLLDVINATIKDEMLHRDVNHAFANDTSGTNLWF